MLKHSISNLTQNHYVVFVDFLHTVFTCYPKSSSIGYLQRGRTTGEKMKQKTILVGSGQLVVQIQI
jgi:hypothetical protein